MFKRESEQPVRISFEEKREKKKRRSIRERLSSIPVRRRIEAVALSVVTVMASLSIDWSSLFARADGSQVTIESGQSISTIIIPQVEDTDKTTLSKAKISVLIPSAAEAVSYTYKVYQNLSNDSEPESGVEVKQTNNSGTIEYSSTATGHFVEKEVDLSDVVLLGKESAAVVFTLKRTDGSDITYKTFADSDDPEIHYVKIGASWVEDASGACVKYTTTEGGNLKDVTLSGVPEKLALTAGNEYTFSGIKWTPAYKRALTLTTNDASLISVSDSTLAFNVVEDVSKSGIANVTVTGDGVKTDAKNTVTVRVVSFALVEDDAVFPFKGAEYGAAELYTAKCETDIDVAKNFTATYKGTLTDGTKVTQPLYAGKYTMTVKGKSNSDYAGLSYTKDFEIAPKPLEKSMFDASDITMKNGEIDSITDGADGDYDLIYGEDFDAEITETEAKENEVAYKVTLTGKNNFTGSVVRNASESSGVSLESIVDHIEFTTQNSPYDGKEISPTVKLIDSAGKEITGIKYSVRYDGVKRSSGAKVTDAEKIVDAGEYTATIHGEGAYIGSSMTTLESKPYVISPIRFVMGDNKNVTVSLKESSFEYSDSLVINPEIADVTYKVSGTETRGLAAGTEYVLKNEEYSKAIGNHNVTILGYGNYEGEATAEYTVFAPLLDSTSIALTLNNVAVTDGTMRAEKTTDWDYVWTHNRPYTYTGSPIAPTLTANINGETLAVGKGDNDMTQSLGVNNTAVSTANDKAYFILTLPAKFANKKIKVEFEIAAVTLPDTALSFKAGFSGKKPYAYGTKITLSKGEYTVKAGSKTLTEGTDYTISYENNVDAGEATITATGKGNYSGTSSKTFTIEPIDIELDEEDPVIFIKPQKLDTSGTRIKDMSDVVITVIDNQGKELHPFDSDDFELSEYKNNTKAWTSESDGDRPQVKLTGKGNLTGERVVEFNISKESLEGLRWKLYGTNVEGTLGSPGTTVDLTATYGYEVAYKKNLTKKFIIVYSGNTQLTGGYSCITYPVVTGTNTIKITGKGNYYSGEDGVYTFTYEVRKSDINGCNFDSEGGTTSTLPTFTLSSGGTALTENTDYKVTAVDGKAVKEGDTYTLGEHTVTFEGIGSYTGTRTDDFLIGTPFDSDHVFVTMYGPAGTGTSGSDNRLTYFGDNDPYFILTNKDGVKLNGPVYTKGVYGNTGTDYEIASWSISDPATRHKVGSTVTVTFKAKEGNGTWYNPSDGTGVTYKYNVVAGTYENLVNGLRIYTKKKDSSPVKSDNVDENKFPTQTSGGYGGNISIENTFEFPYATEEKDPEIWISYDPSTVTTLPENTKNSDNTSVTFASGEVPLNGDLSPFNASKQKISAKDSNKTIAMTAKSGGWITTGLTINLGYTFNNAKLSDATFVFSPAEYPYTGAAAAVNYSVKLGGSTLTKDPKDPDFVEVGYYNAPSTEVKASDLTADNLETKLGTSLGTAVPINVGSYVLVIGPAEGGHYDGYNIAKFTIVTATFEAALRDPDNFSVKYGDTSKNAPAGGSDENNPGDLVVTGVGGKLLYLKENTSKDDGYYIEVETASPKPGINSGVANIKGTGNYAGCTRQVKYKVVADISSGKNPNFNETNLSLLDKHNVVGGTEALELRLKNDGGLPFIVNTTTRFDPDTLTLGDGNVTLDSSDLKVIVSGEGSESGDSLTTVGKKKITIEAASSKAPVTGSREYYVEVFGDISTADVTLKADKTIIKDGIIPYTGDSISVIPELDFRGDRLDVGTHYTNSDGTTSFSTIGNHSMTLKGIRETETSGKYYKGTKIVPFSIEYDLKNGVGIYFKEDDGSLVPLSKKSFDYTGSPIGPTISEKIEVRLTKNSVEVQETAYTLDIANDTYPGANKASATISPVSGKSFNSQTVYFSIGGNKLTETNSTITLVPKPEDDPDFYKYDGTAKTPKVSVSYTDKDGYPRTLEQGTDYSVTYKDNINVTDKAIVLVTGINARYTGTISKSFAITKKSLNDPDVTVEVSDVPFGGKDSNGNRIVVEPEVVVTIGEKKLKKGTDFEIKYPNNVVASAYLIKDADETYTVYVEGIGNYEGTFSKNDVKQLAGTLDTVSIDPSLLTSVFDGTNQKGKILSGIVVKNGECTLEKGTDYDVKDPGNIINAKKYEITITATTGDYADNGKGSSKTFTYTVTPRSVEDNAGDFAITLYDPETGNTVSDGMGFKWTGSKIEPAVKLEDKGISPDAGVATVWTNKDGQAMDGFAVTYGTNTDAGSKEDKAGTVTLTASGNYTGTLTRYFAIGQDIANATISYDKYTADYDGTAKTPEITVKYNGKTLTPGTDYESPVTYSWTGGTTTTPTAVGSYKPVIKGKGGYYGKLEGDDAPFRIIAKNKTGDIRITFNGPQGEVEAADYVCHYNASKQEPSIYVYDISSGSRLTRYIDYDVTYGNNTNAGSGYVYVALKGNYTGTAQEIFTIQPYDISNATLQFTEGENGVIKNVAESKFPYSPLFKLVGIDDNGKPFEIGYANSTYKPYLIVPDSSKVKKPGKGTLTVSGQGNLFGTTNACEYEVYGRLSESNVSVKAPVYTGTKKDPEVTVTFAGEKLVLDTDYSLRIIPYDQTATGGGNVVVTGLGYFSGSVYTKYGEAGEVSALELRGYSQQYVYSGSFAGPSESALYAADSEGNVIIPADKLNCTFTSSVDKTACVSAGATVTITSKATLDDGSVVDGPSGTYKIVARDISSCDVKQLSSDNYTGKPLTPPISVSYDRKTYSGTVVTGHDVMALVSGRDYSLSYSNNINPGTAVVTVTGKGNYTGSKRFMFTIKVADMATVTAKQSSGSTIVTWTARPHVTGYRVLYNTNGMTKIETRGTTITLKDALPTTVGVQAIVKDSNGKVTYGTPKYVAVTN